MNRNVFKTEDKCGVCVVFLIKDIPPCLPHTCPSNPPADCALKAPCGFFVVDCRLHFKASTHTSIFRIVYFILQCVLASLEDIIVGGLSVLKPFPACLPSHLHTLPIEFLQPVIRSPRAFTLLFFKSFSFFSQSGYCLFCWPFLICLFTAWMALIQAVVKGKVLSQRVCVCLWGKREQAVMSTKAEERQTGGLGLTQNRPHTPGSPSHV